MTEATPELRWCAGCRTDKPPTAFHKSSRRCRECMRVQAQRRKAVDYDAELEDQDGKCAICGKPPGRWGQRTRLVIDHDPATGHFRGLVCDPCNLMLGYAGEDPALFLAAAAYMKRPPRALDLPPMYRRPRHKRYPVILSHQEPAPPEPRVSGTAILKVQLTRQSGSR
jgi:hypothetical protein